RAPTQLSLFDEIAGVKGTKLSSKAQVEREKIQEDESGSQELKQLDDAVSVLEEIAKGHLNELAYAQAIMKIAPQLASANPVELLVQMARWTIENLNGRGATIRSLLKEGRYQEANRKAGELEIRIQRARHYFQRFWRLDQSTWPEIPSI